MPLLLELGAAVPAGGLFVLEAELDRFPEMARTWSARSGGLLAAARSSRSEPLLK